MKNIEKHSNDNKRNPAFACYLAKTQKGQQLPRGKFFRDKEAGQPVLIVDTGNMTLDYTKLSN